MTYTIEELENEFDDMDFSEFKNTKQGVEYVMMCQNKIKSFYRTAIERLIKELVETKLKVGFRRDYSEGCNHRTQLLEKAKAMGFSIKD